MHRLHRLRVVQIIWIWQFLMAAIGMISIIFVSMRHVDEGGPMFEKHFSLCKMYCV